ncbi:MAG: hypothetical protein Q8Q31_04750 [Nanoarchaeota archaeon]|nr:hypothetical protein [Nanoarchaeota archaeon]
MDLARKLVDLSYDLARPVIFGLTENNPERAHKGFIKLAQAVHALRLERFLLDNEANDWPGIYRVSNAAGFNKNGEIPASFLRYLGFDRNVIGTVTADPWVGNPDSPRIWRYAKTGSLVNCLGLPGLGAEGVARNIEKYALGDLPITINVMATPGKKGKEIWEDVRASVHILKDFPGVDRIEANVSCPNTHSQSGALDARRENQQMVAAIVDAINEEKRGDQSLYVKVSPDLDQKGIQDTYRVLQEKGVRGIVATNTTTIHDPRYISPSPGKGGGSGDAVYDRSLQVQRAFWRIIQEDGSHMEVIACGGIDSIVRAREKTCVINGAREVQIYTPLIFKGPRLLRHLRRGY